MIAAIVDRVRKGSRYRYRSAETGEYVTWLYAKLHPATTIRETVRSARKPPFAPTFMSDEDRP